MIVGIDYSIKSPAICIQTGGLYIAYYWGKEPKMTIKGMVIDGYLNWFMLACVPNTGLTEIKRYHQLATWVESMVKRHSKEGDEILIAFEGCSFGSPGRIVQLAENIGAAKVAVSPLTDKIFDIPPQSIKKFATGNGRAEKIDMYNAFKAKTDIDLVEYLGCKPEDNPLSDIVDAYWITQYLINNKETLIRGMDPDVKKTAKKKKRSRKKAKPVDL